MVSVDLRNTGSRAADEVAQLQDWAVDGLVPHLTVVVDIDPGEGRRRRGAVHDRMESEAEAFHATIRGRFLSLASDDGSRYLVVDGSADPAEIASRVWARVVEEGWA